MSDFLSEKVLQVLTLKPTRTSRTSVSLIPVQFVRVIHRNISFGVEMCGDNSDWHSVCQNKRFKSKQNRFTDIAQFFVAREGRNSHNLLISPGSGFTTVDKDSDVM